MFHAGTMQDNKVNIMSDHDFIMFHSVLEVMGVISSQQSSIQRRTNFETS